jgi:hypothetical protein
VDLGGEAPVVLEAVRRVVDVELGLDDETVGDRDGLVGKLELRGGRRPGTGRDHGCGHGDPTEGDAASRGKRTPHGWGGNSIPRREAMPPRTGSEHG